MTTVSATEGFGAELRARMSPSLQRQIAQQEANEAREAAVESRRREQEREQWHERNLQAAAREAVERGESVIDALAGRNLGRTPGEFVRQRYAIMDVEDAMERGRQAAAFRRWQAAQGAATSADTTAATQVELEHATRAEEQRAEEVRRGWKVRNRKRDVAGQVRAEVNRALGQGVWAEPLPSRAVWR